MRIPCVIDNIEHTLAQVLNHLLSQQDGQRLDVATAYFSVRGDVLGSAINVYMATTPRFCQQLRPYC